MDIPRPKSKQPFPENAKKVFSGILFDVYQWEQELYDGSFATFERLKRPDTVLVLPVCDDGRIILIKEEQPGKVASSIRLLGGRVESGEEILAAVKRELLEEGGYTAEEFVFWKAEQPINKIDWVIYIFVAKGVKKVHEQNLDSGEKIELIYVTFDEFFELVKEGEIADRDVVIELFQALGDPEKKETLRELFSVK